MWISTDRQNPSCRGSSWFGLNCTQIKSGNKFHHVPVNLAAACSVGKKVMEWKLTFRPYLSAWEKHVNGINWYSKQVCVGRRPQKSPPRRYTIPFIFSNGPRRRNGFALCLCWIHASVFISTVSADCSLWLKVQLFWLSTCYAYRIITHFPCLILQSSVCVCRWLPGLCPCKARDCIV